MNRFLGQGWAFPPELHTLDSPTRMVSDEDDIRQSLIILLSTRIGERVYRPEYGTDLYLYSFEQIDLTAETNISNSIHKAVNLFETRVSLDRIEFNQTNIGEGILDIGLFYTILISDRPQELVFPLHLDTSR